MKHFQDRIHFALALAVAFVSAGPLAAQPQPKPNWCGTAAQREFLKYRLREIAHESDSTAMANGTAAAMRRIIPTRVEIITNQTICERATRAYYRYTLGPLHSDGVAVGRFGDRYGVYGDLRGGEWTILEIFTLEFEGLGAYLS